MYTVEDIDRALQAVLDPNSSREYRNEANNYLDGFKKSTSVLSIGFHLINKDNGCSTDLMMFGINSIEYCISEYFDTWNEETKGELKKSTLEAFVRFTGKNFMNNIIKEKTAQLIVKIHMKSWLSEWPQLTFLMENLLLNDPSNSDMVYVIIRYFSDSLVSGDVDSKKELLYRLRLYVIHIQKSTSGAMQNSISEVIEKDKRGEDSALTKSIIVEWVKMWLSLMEWISLDLVIEAKMIPVCLGLLNRRDDVLRTTLEVMLVLVNRKVSKKQYNIYEMLMRDVGFFLNIISDVNISGVSDETHEISKLTSQVLKDFGTSYVSMKQLKWFDPEFTNFLEGMLFFLSHKSMVISLSAASFWVSVLRVDMIVNHKLFKEVLEKVIGFVTYRLINTDEYIEEGRIYNDIDFGDNKEHDKFVKANGTLLYDILKLVAGIKPVEILQYTLALVESMVDSNADNIGQEKYHASTDNSIVFINSVFAGLTPLDRFGEEMVGGMSVILHTVLQRLILSNVQDPATILKFNVLISDISILLGKHHKDVRIVMDRMMRFIIFQFPKDYVDSNNEISRLRQVTSNCLVKLVKVFSNMISDYYYEIAGEIRNALDLDYLKSSEKSSLVEVLLLICKNISPEEKKNYYDFVSGPILGLWQSDVTRLCVSSFEGFCNVSGMEYFIPLPGVEEKKDYRYLESTSANREHLLYVCKTIEILFKLLDRDVSCGYNDGAVFLHNLSSLVFEDMIKLTTHVHSVWDIESHISDRNMRCKSLLSLILLNQEERKEVNRSVELIVKSGEFMTKSVLVEIKTFLDTLRQSCYGIIGSILENDTNFFDADLFRMFVIDVSRCETGPVANMQFRYWKIFTEFVYLMYKNLDENRYNGFLYRFLPQMLDRMTDTLSFGWCKLRTYEKIEKEEDEYSIEEEIIYERHLRKASGIFIGFVHDLLFSRCGLRNKKEPLSHYAFHNETLSEVLFRICVQLSAFGYFVLIDKIVLIYGKLVSMAQKSTLLNTFIQTKMVENVFGLLSRKSTGELHDKMISLMVEVYRRPSFREGFDALCKSHYVLGSESNYANLSNLSCLFDSQDEPRKKKLMKLLLNPIVELNLADCFDLVDQEVNMSANHHENFNNYLIRYDMPSLYKTLRRVNIIS